MYVANEIWEDEKRMGNDGKRWEFQGEGHGEMRGSRKTEK